MLVTLTTGKFWASVPFSSVIQVVLPFAAAPSTADLDAGGE